MSDEMVEIFFEELEHETVDAWLIVTADGDKVWLPKSQCELDENDSSVEVPEWLAIKEGLV
jgi:hypothetical protein